MPYPISHSLVRAFSVLLTPELISKHSQKDTNLSNLQQHNSQDATYNLRKIDNVNTTLHINNNKLSIRSQGLSVTDITM